MWRFSITLAERLASAHASIENEDKMTAQSKYALSYLDFSKEDSTVTYTGVALDGDNFDAQLVLAHNLRTATDNITIGARIKEEVTAQINGNAADAPTDVNAQRERKWLVRYKDTTQYYDAPSTAYPNPGYGKKFTLEVPTADLSLLPTGHSDVVDASASGLNAALTAYFAAFNAFQRSPYNGVAEVTELVAVGRNL